MQTAFVVPKSRKAKNCFSNLMEYNDECIIEKNKGNKLFLMSMNRKYKFWVSLNNDSDWDVDI